MPYVQRDPTGKIVCSATNPQPQQEGSCLTESEFLPDDHPEVIEFMKRFPMITQGHMTEEDFKREEEDQKRVDKEIPELQTLALAHISVWASLETALSALLYTALNIQPASSHIAYAIYYGLTGFDARLTVVNNVIIQLMNEKKELESLREHWEKLHKKIDIAKNRRNTVAHSTIQTLIYGSKPRKKRAVLSPLPFDVIRLQRKIEAGEDPGLDVNQFTTVVERAFKLAECIDSVNRVISNFHQYGKDTLLKTIPAVESRMKELNSL